MLKRLDLQRKIDFSSLTMIAEPDGGGSCTALAELIGCTWIEDRWLPLVEPFLKRQGVHLVEHTQSGAGEPSK